MPSPVIRGGRVAGLAQRHAEFCARCAVAYATFVLDRLADPEAPWWRLGQDGASLGG